MQDYTIDLRPAPSAQPAHWLISFVGANAAMLALILALGPLTRSRATVPPPPPPVRPLELEMAPAPVPALAAIPPQPAVVQQPVATPPVPPVKPVPPPEATPPQTPPAPTAQTPPPAPPAPEKPAEQPPKPDETPTPALSGDTQLAFNANPTDDGARPADAHFAGETNTAAASRNPTPGSHDPVPISPEGRSGDVLALGQSGTPGTQQKGITTAMSPNPTGAPALKPAETPANTNPTTVKSPDQPAPSDQALAHVATTAAAQAAAAQRGDPTGTAATGAVEPVQPQATPTAPLVPPPPAATPAGPGVELVPPLGTIAAPAAAVTLPTAPPTALQTPPTAIQHGDHGTAEHGSGTNPASDAPTDSATASADAAAQTEVALAAERKYLAQLQAADAAKPGTVAQPATVQVTEAPTAGDSNAVSKTPFWTMHLNTANAGADTIETYKEPAAKYLREFRTLLEQSFYREANLPRAYRFRDGEFADFEMTFHADGSIDAVRMVPNSASKYFTAEMEAICKAAITRSSPYKAFTEELLKDRKQFTLKVRFQF